MCVAKLLRDKHPWVVFAWAHSLFNLGVCQFVNTTLLTASLQLECPAAASLRQPRRARCQAHAAYSETIRYLLFSC